MNRAYESEKPKFEAHPSNKWTQNQEKTNGSNTKNKKYNYCTIKKTKILKNPKSLICKIEIEIQTNPNRQI